MDEDKKDVQVDVDKPKEVDYTALDPSKIPHDVVQQTPAMSGVLGELSQTRAEYAAEKAAREQVEADLEAARESDDEDDEGFVSRKELTATVEAALAKQREEDAKKGAEDAKIAATSKQNATYAKLQTDT